MGEEEAIRLFAAIALFLSVTFGALFPLFLPGGFLMWYGIFLVAAVSIFGIWTVFKTRQ